MPSPIFPQCNLHDWSGLRTELLFVYDQLAPKGSERERGTRDREFSAWLVRKGKVRLKADGETAESGAGNWILCFGREIEQELSPGAHLLSLRFRQGWPDGTPLFSGSTLYVFPAARCPALERSARLLLRTVQRITLENKGRDPSDIFLWKPQLDYFSYLRHEKRLFDFLAELARELTRRGASMNVQGGNDARLTAAFRLLDSLPLSEPFPAEAAARQSGLGVDRLNRLCVKTYGFTLHAYWERRRFAHAREALAHPALRIKETASNLGFNTLPHFSAWFRRLAGMPPREFRREALAGGQPG